MHPLNMRVQQTEPARGTAAHPSCVEAPTKGVPMNERTAPVLSRRTVLGGALGLIAASGLPVLSGCTSAESGGSVDLSGKITLLGSGLPRQAVAVADAPHLAEVVAGIRAFGTGLHRVASNPSTNWTVSPLSISLAFGMLRAGARGRTAGQIDAAFGYPPTSAPAGSPHEALNALSAALVEGGDASSDESVLDIANGLFLDTAFAAQVRSAYLQLLSRQYGADAMAVRFADPSAAATINDWVTAQTRGRINRLFDDLDPSTVLVLADAVYLKTTWQSQFLKSATTPGPFHRAGGGPVDVPMMFQTVPSARYASTSQWQRISLPYAKHGLAMRIVLPRDTASDVASLTSALTAALAPTTHDNATGVDLTLPRWDTATTPFPLPKPFGPWASPTRSMPRPTCPASPQDCSSATPCTTPR